MPSRNRYALGPILLVLMLATACAAAATPTPTPTPTPAAAAPTTEDPWAATPAEHRSMDGQRLDFDCPPGGETRIIWGSDVYTDDSSVCTAAVHAGAITVADGGTVTIEIRPGQDSYESTERNGIESSAYGQWGGSFVIVTD